MELDNNNRSVFLMNYHLVLVIKNRKKIIDHDVSERLKEIFLYIQPNYNISLQEWNYQQDYVHVLFKGHPNSELSKFINAYKSASSRHIKKEFPLSEEHFWSKSFCLLTADESSEKFIKQYIETQK